MSDFKDLKVWQRAHTLALNVDRLANRVRAPAYTSLRSQMIRAAMSIDANIVEGRGHRSDRQFCRYLQIAISSCYELESHLIMARDVELLTPSDVARLLAQLIEVRKMLFGLLRYLENRNPERPS